MSPPGNAYDRVPYPSHTYVQTHPDRLAVMSALFGMDSPDVKRCTVLEIGCGEGANLIPMAFGLPHSDFVGIDLATNPIQRARGLIDHVGLNNIRVLQMDLMEIGPEFGQFDYIIAHGIYAWVPPAVQEKLLDICHQNLTRNGVAFVSYNANPGGHLRRILRDMMLFHTRGMEESAEPIREAKAYLQFVIDAMPMSTPSRAALQCEFEQLCARDDNVIHHDDLAVNFSPVYFADFVARAAAHGLQFLSEAKLSDEIESPLDPEKRAALEELAGGDLISLQQTLDFVRCRKFRQTLLCHKEIPLRRDQVQECLRRLIVASPLRRAAEHENGVVEFANQRGPGAIKTNNPITLAVLHHLQAIWPRGESFEDLCRAVRSALPDIPEEKLDDELSQTVLHLAISTLVDLRTYHIALAERVSEKPVASALARLQAQDGFVTTLLHTQIKIEDAEGRKFLQLLDGTRDRQALIAALAENSPDMSRDALAAQVNGNLEELCRKGLLVN